jgi:hypothetical protein
MSITLTQTLTVSCNLCSGIFSKSFYFFDTPNILIGFYFYFPRLHGKFVVVVENVACIFPRGSYSSLSIDNSR